MHKRYFHTFEKLFAEIKPTFIGELGTHDGDSAKQFCNLALRLNQKDKVVYHGYDAFEMVKGDKNFAKQERNAKGNGNLYLAENRLRGVKLAHLNRFDFKLFKGFTQDTLTEDIAFDFVYIDAGHSYDSVVYDWNRVKNSKMVVFDDTKLKSVRDAIRDHVEPTHSVEFTVRSETVRGLAIVRNF